MTAVLRNKNNNLIYDYIGTFSGVGSMAELSQKQERLMELLYRRVVAFGSVCIAL